MNEEEIFDLLEEETKEEEKETQNLPSNIQELAVQITTLEEQIKALKMLEVQKENLKLKIKEAIVLDKNTKISIPPKTIKLKKWK